VPAAALVKGDDRGRRSLGARTTIGEDGLEPGSQTAPGRNRRRWIQAFGDLVPELVRGIASGVGQESGHLVMLAHLDDAPDALPEVDFDLGLLFRFQRVEGIGPEELFDLLMS
jgi:hypothetical protein